jgi:ribonucleoside-triphosphate reductase
VQIVIFDKTCRTANGLDVNAIKNFKRNIQCVLDEKFEDIDDIFSGSQKDGRGNICPVTIILPTLALMTKQKVDKKVSDKESEGIKYTDEEIKKAYHDEFFKLLEKKLGEAKDTLIERFNHIASQSPSAAKFMYENGTMAGYHENEGIISSLSHGTLTLGEIGVAETLIILFGYDHTDPRGMDVAVEIEELYDKKCAEYKKEYSLNFATYYTPAENLCFTAMKNFKKKFNGFEQENVTYFNTPVMVEDENGRMVQALNEDGTPKYEKT